MTDFQIKLPITVKSEENLTISNENCSTPRKNTLKKDESACEYCKIYERPQILLFTKVEISRLKHQTEKCLFKEFHDF